MSEEFVTVMAFAMLTDPCAVKNDPMMLPESVPENEGSVEFVTVPRLLIDATVDPEITAGAVERIGNEMFDALIDVTADVTVPVPMAVRLYAVSAMVIDCFNSSVAPAAP